MVDQYTFLDFAHLYLSLNAWAVSDKYGNKKGVSVAFFILGSLLEKIVADPFDSLTPLIRLVNRWR